MKRVYYFKYLALVFVFIFPIFVNASNLTASISCPQDKQYVNSTFSCNVTVYPSVEAPITIFKSNIVYSTTDFSLVGIDAANGWENNSSSSIDFAMQLGDGDTGLSSSLQIATLKFKVKESTSYGTKYIRLSGGSLASDTNSASVKLISKNNNLSNLSVEGETINFYSNVTRYNLETSKSSINIKATLADNNSHFASGFGPRVENLKYGTQEVQVIVVSENGENKIYTINVTRPDNRSNNNSLSSLVVSSGTLSPVFSKGNLTYSVDVPNNVESVTISATTDNNKASFVSGYGPRTVNIKNGTNNILLQVKAENGAVRTYTINIIRNEKSANNYLKSITLSNGKLNFDKNIFEYKVNVLYDINELIISGEPEDSNARIEIYGNKSLKVGENEFNIKVIAVNKSERIYKIIVNRLEEGKKLSSNNYLKSLLITNYKINFNKNTLSYNLNIKKETKLNILAKAEENAATVLIRNNNNLKDGSKIDILVTSENGTLRTYSINITKKNVNYLPYIGIALLVIILVLFILYKDKILKLFKKNNDNNNSDIPKDRLIINDKNKDNNDENKTINKDKPKVEYKSLDDTLVVKD